MANGTLVPFPFRRHTLSDDRRCFVFCHDLDYHYVQQTTHQLVDLPTNGLPIYLLYRRQYLHSMRPRSSHHGSLMG
jgi:hypothetical protein